MAINKEAYTKQKTSAKQRGIAWEFDFDSWVRLWEQSGHEHDRGIGKGRYVMARFGDKGPYSVDNVEIVLCEKNASDARKNNPRSKYDLRSKQIGSGRGWTFSRGKFQVCVSRKYIGRFASQEDAEKAYKQASLLMLSSSPKSVAGVNPLEPEGDRK